MDVIRALDKYWEAVRSEEFARFANQFGSRLCASLAEGYAEEEPETELVQTVESVVNSLRSAALEVRGRGLRLRTKAAFIHGNRSMVEFDYRGERSRRELGDLIFVISVVYEGQRCFEKFTITQFKRDSSRRRVVSWDVSNRKQLFLLSRWPTFRGVSGSIVPNIEHNLANYSGCLGSYGLLYRPGDFALVSAITLDSILGHKRSIRKSKLAHLYQGRQGLGMAFGAYPDVPPDPEIWLWLTRRYREERRWVLAPFCWSWHYASDTFDFSRKYLTMGIGEPAFMIEGFDDPQARAFLWELLSAARSKAGRDRDRELLDLTKEFFRYPYAGGGREGHMIEGTEFDYEGGGMGIIHTVIDLGE